MDIRIFHKKGFDERFVAADPELTPARPKLPRTILLEPGTRGRLGRASTAKTGFISVTTTWYNPRRPGGQAGRDGGCDSWGRLGRVLEQEIGGSLGGIGGVTDTPCPAETRVPEGGLRPGYPRRPVCFRCSINRSKSTILNRRRRSPKRMHGISPARTC